MMRLPVYRGHASKPALHVTVDDADHARLSQHRWLLTSQGRICRGVPVNGQWRLLTLSRDVLGLSIGGRGRVRFRTKDHTDFRRANLIAPCVAPEPWPYVRMAEAEPADDHTLLLSALVAGVARWEPLCGGPSGEVCVGGMRYFARLDEAGCPRLSDPIRGALQAAMSRRVSQGSAPTPKENAPHE